MAKLRKAVQLETTFDVYTVDEIIGEGGAGRVYGGTGGDGAPVALKVLTKTTSDTRRRFKNETSFLAQNKHPNIVKVTDHGVAATAEISGPFYVMPRYSGSLRDTMKAGIVPEQVLPCYGQILDGVEAAHFQNVVHRDLKPENVLCDGISGGFAIADFGVASFTADLLVTLVETSRDQRLANFEYSAPEQRSRGKEVSLPADIWALGLILNELFTGVVPHGTEPRLIAQVAPEYGFLDQIVAAMLRQSPAERPASINAVKLLIQKHKAEAVSLQKISKLDGTVIDVSKVDDPLAISAPRLVSADWNRGTLTLTLDRSVSPRWIQALHQMGSYSSVMGKPPQVFSFTGKQAVVPAAEHEIQMIIDNFKVWLNNATQTLKAQLEQEAQQLERQRKEQLRREKEAEEQRLRVNRNIRV